MEFPVFLAFLAVTTVCFTDDDCRSIARHNGTHLSLTLSDLPRSWVCVPDADTHTIGMIRTDATLYFLSFTPTAELCLSSTLLPQPQVPPLDSQAVTLAAVAFCLWIATVIIQCYIRWRRQQPSHRFEYTDMTDESDRSLSY